MSEIEDIFNDTVEYVFYMSDSSSNIAEKVESLFMPLMELSMQTGVKEKLSDLIDELFVIQQNYVLTILSKVNY